MACGSTVKLVRDNQWMREHASELLLSVEPIVEQDRPVVGAHLQIHDGTHVCHDLRVSVFIMQQIRRVMCVLENNM